MPFFTRPSTPATATAADLQAVSERLDAVATRLDTHRDLLIAQGSALARLPEDMLAHVQAEIRDVAADLARRAWVAAKKEAMEKGIKWAVRGGFAAITAYGLSWVHALLGIKGGGQ